MARGREPDHRTLNFNNRERDRSPIREIGDMTSDRETNFAGGQTSNIPRGMLENHFSRWGNVADVKPSRVGLGQDAAPPPAPPGLGNNNIGAGPSGYSSGSGGGGNGRGGGMWGQREGYSGGRDHLPSPREDPYYDAYYSDGKTRESEGHHFDEYYRNYYHRPIGESSGSGNYYRNENPRPPPTRSYESPYKYPSEPLDPLDAMRPNDVEIVVPNKAQRAYAESIEVELKRMNILVDLLFPPPDITPARVLNDLTDRHCLYAIFATSENEKHNSLTLNILHGEPQEHRNMPVEDALRLIQRNFEDYVKQTRMRTKRQVVPRDIRNLLLDLLEMRSLSMGDLDKLIKYLRERQNALVDDQIEQKREIAETQSSLVAGGMAVTYPGYNYITSTIPGSITDTTQASVAAAAAAAAATAPQGIISAGAGAPSAVSQTSSSVNIVSSPNAAAAAIAAYSTTAYTTTGVLSAYGVAPQSQAPHQIMAGPPSAVPAPAPSQPPQTKQADLQERILNLMKNQSGHGQGGMSVASVAPGPPTGVPPPSVVQDHRMIQQQHQQPNPPSMWMQHGAPPPPPPDNGDKVQGSQHAYNPWSQ